MTDQEIIQNIAKPELNRQAFNHILEKYQKKIYWHIRKMVIDHDDADDVTQETLAEPKVKETSNTQCLRYNTNPMLAIQENIEITCNKIDETNTSEECLYSQFSHNIFRIIEVTDEMVKFEMKYHTGLNRELLGKAIIRRQCLNNIKSNLGKLEQAFNSKFNGSDSYVGAFLNDKRILIVSEKRTEETTPKVYYSYINLVDSQFGCKVGDTFRNICNILHLLPFEITDIEKNSVENFDKLENSNSKIEN